MKSITELLKLHTAPGIRLAEGRRVCAGALQSVLGITVSPDQLSYTNGVISLSLPPVVKSAALMKRTEIIALLKSADISITEIR